MTMRVYKNDILLKTVSSKCEANMLIKEEQEKDYQENLDLREKIRQTISWIENLRPRKIGELRSAYIDYINKTNRDIIYNLLDIGHIMYGMNLRDIYLYTNDAREVGFLVNKNYKRKRITLENTYSKALTRFSTRSDFRIEA